MLRQSVGEGALRGDAPAQSDWEGEEEALRRACGMGPWGRQRVGRARDEEDAVGLRVSAGREAPIDLRACRRLRQGRGRGDLARTTCLDEAAGRPQGCLIAGGVHTAGAGIGAGGTLRPDAR